MPDVSAVAEYDLPNNLTSRWAPAQMQLEGRFKCRVAV